MYEGRAIRTKKQCRLFYVADSPKASERNVLPQLLFDGFRDQTFHPFGVFNRPGRNAVHTNAIAAPFNCQIARERVDSGLRSRYVKLHRCTTVMKRGANVENLALMFLELRESCAANVESALEI